MMACGDVVAPTVNVFVCLADTSGALATTKDNAKVEAATALIILLSFIVLSPFVLFKYS